MRKSAHARLRRWLLGASYLAVTFSAGSVAFVFLGNVVISAITKGDVSDHTDYIRLAWVMFVGWFIIGIVILILGRVETVIKIKKIIKKRSANNMAKTNANNTGPATINEKEPKR